MGLSIIQANKLKTVLSIKDDKKVDKCIFLNFKDEFFVPYDHSEFINYSQNDYWNQYLYQKISKNFIKENKIIIKEIEKSDQAQILKKASSYFGDLNKNSFSIKNFFLNLLNIINRRKYN